MNKDERVSGEVMEIDVLHILQVLWHWAWAIVLVSVIGAIIAFLIATLVISPTYSSTIKLYVNNGSFSLGSASFTISGGDITASERLVKTYGEILNSRTTLERVVEASGLNYTYRDLMGMLSYGSSNNTEIMYVTVKAGDPFDASKIANAIAGVLQARVSEIIKGATMEIVDSAIPNLTKVGPNVTKYTGVGFLIGFVLSAAAIVGLDLLDTTIHDDDFITNHYNYPILARIPDLFDDGSKRYGSRYYSYYYRKHYYYGNSKYYYKNRNYENTTNADKGVK